MSTQASGKKVLIVTYYWPPLAGSGVQRWLKFVKYLPKFGWTPHVFTPENPSFSIRDSSLEKNIPSEAVIVRFPIWEPYEIFFGLSRIFGGKRDTSKSVQVVKKSKSSLFDRLSGWVRANFFFPDPRVYWAKPSAKFLEKYLADEKINIVITTGPPHSMHLVGMRLKKRNPSLTWIADFRDPWSEWGFLDSLNLSESNRKKHRELEAQVLRTADHVITITPFYQKQFARLGNRTVDLFTNGFDEDDFVDLQYKRPSNFVMLHGGIINEKCDPRPLVHALNSLIETNEQFFSDLSLEFVGDVHPEFRAFVEGFGKLNTKIAFTPYMPHRELMSRYASSSLLILVLHGYKDAEGYMPGKLFEYVATGLPVLGIGPSNGDAAALINFSSAGKMFEAERVEEIKTYILQIYQQWKASTENERSDNAGRFALSRREITRALSSFLDLAGKGKLD